jgi:hypothetical protein
MLINNRDWSIEHRNLFKLSPLVDVDSDVFKLTRAKCVFRAQDDGETPKYVEELINVDAETLRAPNPLRDILRGPKSEFGCSLEGAAGEEAPSAWAEAPRDVVKRDEVLTAEEKKLMDRAKRKRAGWLWSHSHGICLRKVTTASGSA